MQPEKQSNVRAQYDLKKQSLQTHRFIEFQPLECQTGRGRTMCQCYVPVCRFFGPDITLPGLHCLQGGEICLGHSHLLSTCEIIRMLLEIINHFTTKKTMQHSTYSQHERIKMGYRPKGQQQQKVKAILNFCFFFVILSVQSSLFSGEACSR